ncbi:MAG: hypothetical protein KAQ83_03900 [Nanoarchaeota archaeon]|nr:hypothetical protein [Nanoarchaeota archaeon]
MAISINLLFGKKDSVKNLVFSILSKEYPLKIIQLTNYIKKRYAKSVTFQGVRCAIMELVLEGVLIKEDNKYLINKQWVFESKKCLDELYQTLQLKKKLPKKMDSINGEISVFTFNSINELTKFWQEIMNDWINKSDRDNKEFTCYQAAHLWEGLLHLEKEKDLLIQIQKKKIKSVILSTGNSPLDQYMRRFYSKLGVKVFINSSLSSFDKSYYVGVYGDLVLQTEYPIKIVKALDLFFKKNTSIEDLDLNKLSDIVNEKIETKLIVIKNPTMAKQISKSILLQMD